MPEIPLRTSSVRSSKNLTNKRKAESSEDLRAERARIDCHLHKIRKQLKPHGSFDFAYVKISLYLVVYRLTMCKLLEHQIKYCGRAGEEDQAQQKSL